MNIVIRVILTLLILALSVAATLPQLA